jgi:hypothetical protein
MVPARNGPCLQLAPPFRSKHGKIFAAGPAGIRQWAEHLQLCARKPTGKNRSRGPVFNPPEEACLTGPNPVCVTCAVNDILKTVAGLYLLAQPTVPVPDYGTCSAVPRSKECKEASKWQLNEAGIHDEHEFKEEWLGKGAQVSRYDICACKGESIVIKDHGACGKSGGAEIDTGQRWK